MIDLELTQDENGLFDISVENNQLKSTDNFKTAIYVSLFTDARADSSQVFDPSRRRGWIGNIATPIEGKDLGSLIWLTEQERLTTGILNKVIDFANKALDWMIVQNIAKSIEVTGEIIPQKGIRLNIIITSVSGVTESSYVDLWRNTKDGN